MNGSRARRGRSRARSRIARRMSASWGENCSMRSPMTNRKPPRPGSRSSRSSTRCSSRRWDKRTSGRLRGLGRLRAVLRLGERADARPARRPVLAQPGDECRRQSVLELGCGTGRVSMPLGRAGVRLVGIDRSPAMLALARRRVARGRLQRHLQLVAGGHPLSAVSFRDDEAAPPRPDAFAMVMAPYGILQSLLQRARPRSRRLPRSIGSCEPDGTFGLELVADLPSWEEYREARQPEGLARPPRRHARDAGGDRAPGSARVTARSSIRSSPSDGAGRPACTGSRSRSARCRCRR